MQEYTIKDHLKFILPSIIGVFLFMTPIKIAGEFTIPIAVLAGFIQDNLANYLSLIMMLIITLTALCSVLFRIKPDLIAGKPFLQRLFIVGNFWLTVRLLAMLFAIMVYFQLGPEAIYGEDTGQLLLDDLLHVLFSVFLFAGFFLPLLTNFGLLEFIGAFMTKVMRPLFHLPGRSSIDALASWIGDGTIGVLLTSKQYEDGYYTKREAAIIGTTFSIVSITFTIVIIDKLDLMHMFVPFYFSILVAGFVAALIMPRIPPLSRKEDTYIDPNKEKVNETIPEHHNLFTYGYEQAIQRSRQETSVKKFFTEGFKNVLDMWMGVAPVVMAFGLVALVIAEYTSFFQWLGLPFIPLLELMQVPEAKEASQTILIGFADMFLPAIIGSSITSEMTRFIIGALSITQLIYMSEVGGLLLGSKIPVNFKDLIVIFLLRTIITLPIIVLLAHLFF